MIGTCSTFGSSRDVIRSSILVLLLIIGPGVSPAAAAEPVSLTKDGKAQLPVTIAKDASDRVRKAAQTLASYLERISGAKFEIATGDGNTGIVVGRPMLPFKQLWNDKDPTQSEDYLLRSHAKGLYVLGASDRAVEHAVWDLLYRLGHRQFFPGENWEVIPKSPTLSIAVDVKEHPAYYARRIWYGFGAARWAAQPYAEWCARNRAVSGIAISSGHAYDGIIHRNQAEFKKHPEYYGLLNGKRTSSKICISNPGLRTLVIDDALAHFAKDPSSQSVSVDPSDGGGWCECADCKKLGSITDRAVFLANEVAAAVEAKYPDKYVGMYAYSQHSPPPSIKVHPRVVINVATSFITGGYTVDQLLDGWQKQGATVGIREYYSVHPWDRDLPGRARGANPNYLKTTIPHFHAKGARFLSAESSDNWGCNGLGYYLAARILWDLREADRIDALKADFLDKAFGPARGPMAEFYRRIDAANRPLLSDDLVGRLYLLLKDARTKTDDPKILARISDLVLYTRYLEHWSDYANAQGADRQKAFEAMVRHAYRMRKSMMIHTLGLVRDLPRRDKSLSVPKEAAPNVAEGKNPWMSSEPFTPADIEGLITSGIANRKLLDFQPISFSDNLVPATKLNLPSVTTGSMGLYSRGVRTYHTWIETAPATLTFKASSGLIYGNRGAAKIALYPKAEEEGKAVAEAAVAPDKQEVEVSLKTTFKGLHHIDISDRGVGTKMSWPDGLPMTVQSSPDVPAALHGRWSLYFYVPKGTQVVGGFASGAGVLHDGSGKTVHTFAAKPGYFSVPVGPGQDGKLWKFHQSAGQRLLMTVPPYLSRSGKELLLPVEVVERDAAK